MLKFQSCSLDGFEDKNQMLNTFFDTHVGMIFLKRLAEPEGTDRFSNKIHQNDGQDPNNKVSKFQGSMSAGFKDKNQIQNKVYFNPEFNLRKNYQFCKDILSV